jgi:hypothetical protein
VKTLEQLANPALLSLAAKKAHRFLNRHSWYFDRADAAKFSGRLNFNIQRLSNELLSGQYMPSGKLALAAPKRIEIHEDGRKKYVVRPLCAYPFRDQVVEAALVCLFADDFEKQWGDPRYGTYPKAVSFGNRLHRVGELDLSTFRRAVIANPPPQSPTSPRPIKTRPAGFQIR